MVKKIIVPEGMLGAVAEAYERYYPSSVNSRESLNEAHVVVLRAALLWLSENPIVPTEKQLSAFCSPLTHRTGGASLMEICAEWQRLMFLAPEPEISEDVKEFLWDEDPEPYRLPSGEGAGVSARKHHNKLILEAYRRGLEAGKRRK